MTINRIENPGAAIAGYQCIQCNEDEIRERIENNRKSPAERKAQSSRNWKTILFGDPNYVPYDHLWPTETGVVAANRAVERHDELHPDHTIVIWQADRYHPLTPEQVTQLKEAGVVYADAFGTQG